MPTDALTRPAEPAGATLIHAAPTRSSWWAIAILSLTIFSAATMRALFSPVQEAAKLDLHISDFQISLIQGLAASIPIAALALPLGRLTDKGNRIWLLIAMSAVWTAGTIATAFAWDFNTMFLARMLAGLGAICGVPVVISLAADFCKPDERGRAMMPLTMGVQIGGAAAFALGGTIFGLLAAKSGLHFTSLAPWRELHLLFGIVSALLILPLFAMREPPRHEVSHAGIAFGAAMREIWARRAFLAPLFLGQVGAVTADVAAGIWAAPVLTRSYHLEPQQFAAWVGGALLAGGVLGAVFGGLSADLGHRLKMRGGILLGAVIVTALSIPAALFPIMPTATGFGWLLFGLILSGAVAGLSTSAALSVLIPNEIRGLCLSAFIVVATIIGFGVGPTLVTLISGAMGGETHLNMALAVTGVAISALSALGFLVAMLKAPRDAAG